MRKIILFIIFVSISSLLISTTWHIKQDGSGDFTTIQEGIDASVNADTVLVYPGTYYENLNMNEKNITLGSLELTTGNSQYMNSTIIDGQRLLSCIEIQDISIGATIRGFTIQNGYGTYLSVHIGGGILAQCNENLHIVNCIISDNMATLGGGILAVLSEINLSGSRITHNSAGVGGGIFINYNNTITFDSSNLCSIYNNNAGKGYDLYAEETGQINVIVDTFSVFNPDIYFADYRDGASYTFDIQNNFMELVASDLYVSTNGDDGNSGLTSDDPFKTISWAARRIQSDEQNPRTIHIASGTYSWEDNQQKFPIGCKEYVSYIGENAENTIIYNDRLTNAFFGTFLAGDVNISNLTIQNNPDLNTVAVLYFYQTELLIVSNVIIEDNENVLQLISNEFVVSEYENVIIRNNDSDMYAGFGLVENTGFIKNCLIEDNYTYQPDYGTVPSLILDAYDDFVIENCRFINNTLGSGSGSIVALTSDNDDEPNIKVSNCLFSENYSNSDNVVGVYNDGETEFINCTFANNHSDQSTIKAYGDVSLTNSIMWNNTDYEVYIADDSNYGYIYELNVDHSLIKNGEAGIHNHNNANIVNWEDGNIAEEPQFLQSGDDPYQLSDLSPCIDTGTPDTIGLFIPPWDLLYNHRVWDGEGNGVSTIDMGCYEFDAEPYVEINNNELPATSSQMTNFPNPFNPETTISFSVTESSSFVKLEIFNVKGQKVKLLMDCKTVPGNYRCVWNGRNDVGKRVASGEYLAILKVDEKVIAEKKLLLLK